MKDLPFTWKDYLIEQLEEGHVRKKIEELDAAFKKNDDADSEYGLAYLVFTGGGRDAFVLDAQESSFDECYVVNRLVDFTAVKNEVDNNYSSILLDTIREVNEG